MMEGHPFQTPFSLIFFAVFFFFPVVTCVRDQLYSSAETSIASIGSLRILEEKILAEKEFFWYTYINSSSRKIPDTVPLDVNCTKIQRCDKRKICATICAPGSVQVDTWLQETLKIQRKLAYQRTICHVQLPGTHNSAINMADGYGVEDHVFEGYLQYLSWFKPGMKVHTNDQLFSITDQLQMGVRFIELDVHWFNNDLHIAHCGGFHSKLLDEMIQGLNYIAKLLGTDIEWDTETIGCKPSLSSIPASEQRKLTDALKEIATWLHRPGTVLSTSIDQKRCYEMFSIENRGEFLMVFFDDESNLFKWMKVRVLIKYLKEFFTSEEMLLPTDVVLTQGWPSFQELIDSGKRVVFMSGANYSPRGDEVLFVKSNICNWTEPLLPFTGFPTCRFKHAQLGPVDNLDTIFRPETSEIEYGFLNADGHFGPNEFLLNETTLPSLVKCGVNIPSPDNLTPKRMETIVWSFDRNVSPLDHECLVITRESPRWKSVACDIKDKFVAACYGHITNIPENPEDDTVYSAIWKLGNGTSMEADANASCEQNFEYSVPATGYENQLLYALLHNASDSFKGVWINHQKIKSFMSSNHHEQDQEEDKQEHEVLPSDVLNGMLAIE